jgi:hypothetical protein
VAFQEHPKLKEAKMNDKDKVFDQETEIPKTYDAAYISSLRAECAKRRIELKETQAEAARLQTEVDAHEAGQESPTLIAARERMERAEKALAGKNREWDELQLKEKVQKEARRLGALDGDAVFKLMDLEADDLEMEIRRTLDKHPVLIDKKAGPPLPLGPFEVTAEDLSKLGDDGGGK